MLGNQVGKMTWGQTAKHLKIKGQHTIIKAVSVGGIEANEG